MTFEDLPPDVKKIPLTDRRVAADVIDLIIGDEARADGCVGLMVCDEEHRGILPIVLSDVPHDADLRALAALLDMILPLVVARSGSLLMGRGRPGGGVPTDADRAWHQQSIDACRAHGVRLLGFHVATRDGVTALPQPLAAAP
ncbi:hypothetical protein [Humibacillus xanthopallidus]|nr:hypothetical protein [Humibacillus xanthopallidus]